MSSITLSERTRVLKVHLEKNGTTRRIAISKLKVDGIFSFKRLASLVCRYSDTQRARSSVAITYVDEDGDSVSISSDGELTEALEQFVNSARPVILASAKVHDRVDEEKADTLSETSDNLSEKSDTPSETVTVNHVPSKLPPGAGFDFLHCKILVKRVNILEKEVASMWKRIDALTKATKEQSNNTEKETCKTLPSQKVETSSSVSSEKKNSTDSLSSFLPDSQCAVKGLNKDKPGKGFNLEDFDPFFIHSRHTCDGCNTQPIVGYRFRATNLADYDFCQECYRGYKGTGIQFEPEQLKCDEQYQGYLRKRLGKIDQMAKMAVVSSFDSLPPSTPSPTSWVAKEVVPGVDAEPKTTKPTISDKNQNVNTAPLESPNTAKPDIKDNVPKIHNSEKEQHEIISAKLLKEAKLEAEAIKIIAELNVSKEEVTTDHASICEEKERDSETIVTRPTVLASAGFSDDSNDKSKSDEGQKILDGDEDNASEARSENTGENWEMVDEDSQDNDEMVARAAQLLGSALFNSHMTSADVKIATESMSSGHTSAPTISSNSEISEVLLQRWAFELRQLHELGFIDDHVNVDALSHLEAANIGVDSDDPIEINAVIDLLLQNKNGA